MGIFLWLHIMIVDPLGWFMQTLNQENKYFSYNWERLYKFEPAMSLEFKPHRYFYMYFTRSKPKYKYSIQFGKQIYLLFAIFIRQIKIYMSTGVTIIAYFEGLYLSHMMHLNENLTSNRLCVMKYSISTSLIPMAFD